MTVQITCDLRFVYGKSVIPRGHIHTLSCIAHHNFQSSTKTNYQNTNENIEITAHSNFIAHLLLLLQKNVSLVH